MRTFKKLLIEFNACASAIEWAGEKTIEQVVEQCHRGDWLLWLAKRVNVDQRKLILTKGHCANTVRHLMKDERSIKAVDVAIAYGESRATYKELNAAAAAAIAAYAVDTAAYAAYAAYAAADTAAISHVAAYAATAYADAAYAASYAEAIIKNNLQTAEICRKYIGQEIVDKVNALLTR